MTDYAQELLRSSPVKRKPPQGPPETDYASDLLSGVIELDGESLIGGTYAPTRDISSITGKPIKKFVEPAEEEAGFISRMKETFISDPLKKMKMFSEERGIPLSRYRLNPKTKQIEFQNDQGQWQREVFETEGRLDVKGIAAETLADPSTILSIGGALVAGVPGAVGGALVGATAKKMIGKYVFGEELKPIDAIDIAVTGLFAAAGEGVGKAIKFGANRFLGMGKGPLRLIGKEVEEGLLNPKDHLKALAMKNLADLHGIELAPHQLYDKTGMTNMWRYLRQNPSTADAVQDFEKTLQNSTDDAIKTYIQNLGGYKKTAFQVGKEAVETSSKAIEGLETLRRDATTPLYQDSFKNFGGKKVEISETLKDLDERLSQSVSGDPGHKILERVRDMLVEAKGDPQKLHRIKVESIDRVLEQYQGTDKFIMRDVQTVKDKLRETLEFQVKGYKNAQEAFAKASEPIESLKNTIIGELAGVEKSTEIATRWRKLIDTPDPIFIKEAKKEFSDKQWKEIMGSYFRETYNTLRETEEGRLLNVPGKLHKALYGTENKKQIMKEALGKDWQSFDDLMQVFQRASIGIGKSESMTWPFKMIEEKLGKVSGANVYYVLRFPREIAATWAFDKWNDIMVAGKQAKLFEILKRKDITREIMNLKQLSPGSKKFIESFAIFTSMVTKHTLEMEE